MISKERYVAALEISSSKVIGAVGIAGRSGHLDIIAVEQEQHRDIVRYGQIQNSEEVFNMVNHVLERLERRSSIAPREITGVYVGLSGRSLRSIPTDVNLSLPDDTEISDAIVERLRNQAMEADIDSSLEIVDAVPRTFKVGKTETHRPVGMMGNGISATYDRIVARPAIRSNLRRVIVDKLGLDLKGIVVTPLATGYVVLTEQEKKLGCMLVDIGAETTTVLIYSNGNLAYFATLPLGGRNITRDLASLNELEEKAEELKLTAGNAIAPATQSQVTVGRHKQSDISNLVVARSEEIAINIVEQVRYAKLSESDLPEGIVLCGGGSRLAGMQELLSRFSGLKVRHAHLPNFIRMDDAAGQAMESIEVASVMYVGSETDEEGCLEEPQSAPLPANENYKDVDESEKENKKTPRKGSDGSKGGGFKNWLGNKLGKMFTPIGDDDEGDDLD